MKKHFLLLAAIATLSLSSCSDNDTLVDDVSPAKEQNSIIVNGQSAKSVLTLGFLMANHTELPVGSRATDYGYEYDDDDGVFMTEEEAAAFLAPYTQMGRDLRDALISSYFPETSRGGVGDDGGGANPLGDPLIENLPIEDQEAIRMLYEMTDEEVTEVAVILSTMAFDDNIIEVNGCEITTRHLVGCLAEHLLGFDEYDVFEFFYKKSYSYSGRKMLLKFGKKSLIKLFGNFASRFVPFMGYAKLAYDIYNFTNCLLNSDMQKIPDEEYQRLLTQYEWLSEYDLVGFEIEID